MEKWRGRIALVTGGSRGIGLSISKQLVQHGITVYVCCRNTSPITEVVDELNKQPIASQHGKLHAIQCDLQKEEQILAMFEEIKRISGGGGADILVNNCALPSKAPVLTADTETMKKMLDINVLAVSICTREAVKSMRERGVDDGHCYVSEFHVMIRNLFSV